MPTGADIMRSAATILQDEEFARWRPSELCMWLNQGLLAIVLAKPSAKSTTRVLSLAVGTLQSIPAVADAPTPLQLLSVNRNITSEAPTRVGGRVIKAVSGAMLDAQDPYWHDPNRTRFGREVKHIVFDEQNPLEFYCYPGNDGTGKVEAVLGTAPVPLVATGAPDQIDSYDVAVDLPDPYSVPLLDYVLSRSFSKDDTGAQPGRAANHYQLFATAIGLKIQVEGASSPNARRAG